MKMLPLSFIATQDNHSLVLNSLDSQPASMRLTKPALLEKHESLDQEVALYRKIPEEPEVRSVDSDAPLSPMLPSSPTQKYNLSFSPRHNFDNKESVKGKTISIAKAELEEKLLNDIGFIY